MRKLPIRDLMYCALVKTKTGSENVAVVERSENDASFYNFTIGWPEEVRVLREGDSYRVMHSISNHAAKTRLDFAKQGRINPRGLSKYLFLDTKNPADARKDSLYSLDLTTEKESEVIEVLKDFVRVFAQERKLLYSA